MNEEKCTTATNSATDIVQKTLDIPATRIETDFGNRSVALHKTKRIHHITTTDSKNGRARFLLVSSDY